MSRHVRPALEALALLATVGAALRAGSGQPATGPSRGRGDRSQTGEDAVAELAGQDWENR